MKRHRKRLTRENIAILGGFALALAFGHDARADVLTCSRFKTSLAETIAMMGDKLTPPGPLVPDYEAASGRRFTWLGGSGLSGTMTCGASDDFEDFGIVIDEATRTSEALPDALARFMQLASASVCTLSEATPDACRALVKRMTADSLAQFKTAMSQSCTMPTGTRDYFIVSGVDAELVMTPVGISWSIGPGLSMRVDTIRRPLIPKNADE